MQAVRIGAPSQFLLKYVLCTHSAVVTLQPQIFEGFIRTLYNKATQTSVLLEMAGEGCMDNLTVMPSSMYVCWINPSKKVCI